MKNKPNIFDYATSELSQDAFLTWIIQWADEDYKELDNPLNSCAKLFVRELLGKDSTYEIKTVEAGRQWNNIDVWALVNEEYFIVIEDKKGTKEHSDQLNKYCQIAEQHYNTSNVKIRLVYFKMEEQGKYSNIKDAGFLIFKREKMLDILNKYFENTAKEKQNDIISDYHKNLNNLDNEINSFKTKPLQEWGWYAWQGFYSELQKHIGGNWEYVSNASGGFLGFWWHWQYTNLDGKEFEYYLQIEQGKLIFKLYAYKESQRREIRDFYRKILYKNANKLNLGISQFGKIGAYMGVAKLDAEFRKVSDNGLLDFTATIENLKNIMQLIDETEREITAHNTV